MVKRSKATKNSANLHLLSTEESVSSLIYGVAEKLIPFAEKGERKIHYCVI